MPVSFVDLAQTCAPIVAAETLAGVVSLESGFAPFAIRINTAPPLAEQPRAKAEAIEIATSLAAEGHDVQLGLGGVGMEELRKLDLSISDAFDPCLNLQGTATLLDGYYRLAVEAGVTGDRAEQIMLQFWHGRSDPIIGEMVKYDEQVRREIARLGTTLETLTIGNAGQGKGPSEANTVEATVGESSDAREASPPSWDVFNARRRSSVLVFQNSHMEQTK